MDIIGALSEGKRGAIARSADVAAYVAENPDELKTLVYALSYDDSTVVAHAAHALNSVFKHKPKILEPYKEDLLELLLSRDQWELTEQLCKVVPHLGCTSDELLILMEHLTELVKTGKSSIARTCALQAIADIAEIYPIYHEQVNEVFAFAMQHGTKAMQARVRNLLAH